MTKIANHFLNGLDYLFYCLNKENNVIPKEEMGQAMASLGDPNRFSNLIIVSSLNT